MLPLTTWFSLSSSHPSLGWNKRKSKMKAMQETDQIFSLKGKDLIVCSSQYLKPSLWLRFRLFPWAAVWSGAISPLLWAVDSYLIIEWPLTPSATSLWICKDDVSCWHLTCIRTHDQIIKSSVQIKDEWGHMSHAAADQSCHLSGVWILQNGGISIRPQRHQYHHISQGF